MRIPGGGGGTFRPGQFDFARVNTWINDSNGGVQQATFRVDMDQVPDLITKYKEARDMMENILEDAQELQEVAPPGTDEASVDLDNALGHLAGPDHGCLSWAVNDGITRLTDQIEQLEAALRDYQNAEDTATARQA